MKTTTTSHRVGAIAFGAVATVGAGYLLVEDATRSGFNAKHAITIAVLLLAVGAIHYAFASAKARKWGAAIALAVLGIGASALVMAGTASRNAGLDQIAAAEAKADAGKYAEAVRERDEAKKDEGEKRRERDKECKLEGPLCRSARTTAAAYEARLGIAEAKVERLTPKPTPAGIAKSTADTLTTFGVVSDTDKAERVLKSALSLLLSLVLEGSAAAFFLVAFPPKVLTPPKAANEDAPPKVSAPAPKAATTTPTPPRPRKRATPPPADNVVPARMLELLRKRKGEMFGDEIAQALDVDKATVSKARRRLGNKVKVRREGRKVYVAAVA